MEKVPVPLPGGFAYDIFIGRVPELRNELAALLTGRRMMTVADGNTVCMAEAMGLADPVVFPAGEKSKTFASAARLCGLEAGDLVPDGGRMGARIAVQSQPVFRGIV